MKIGIITFHSSNNCGSMLQSYALQKTLTSLGCENEIIDFSNKAQKHMYALFRKPTNVHDIIYDLVTLCYYKKFKLHYSDYRSFLEDKITLTDKSYENNEELKSIVPNYDVFVTGSDQVWNICCPDADDAYYLNFVKDKPKIAYAPSFGATCIAQKSDNPELYKEYLKQMTYISIRENNGAKWIKELIGRDVPVLVDPTMLLTKEDYQKLSSEQEGISGKYIFYYAFNYSDEVNAIVKKISEELGIPVYMLDAKSWVKKAKKYGFKLTKHSGPIAFLNLVMNAELVLTTSFHGTVFSILGEKKFWFINSSMHREEDDRAGTLLKMFELEERVLETSDIEISKSKISSDWNYDSTREILQYERQRALAFLNEALESVKE